MKTVNFLLIQIFVGISYCYAEMPNVLFIAVDDLNDWAGYRGHEQVISPNMDRLAKESIWFSHAYCQYPVCGPSRASVMSGLYFHQLEPEEMQVKDRFVADVVEAMGSSLLHSYFGRHGYKTMAVGKILHRHLPDKGLDLSGGRGGWGTLEDKKGHRLKTTIALPLRGYKAPTIRRNRDMHLLIQFHYACKTAARFPTKRSTFNRCPSGNRQ